MNNYETLFEELVNHNFCKFFLDEQIKKLDYNSSKVYLRFVIISFEKQTSHYWFRICEHQENTKTNYPTAEFFEGTGSMQFFIDPPDEDCNFKNTSYGIMLKLALESFKKYTKTLIKYYNKEEVSEIEKNEKSFWKKNFDERIQLEKNKTLDNYFRMWYKTNEDLFLKYTTFDNHKEIIDCYNKSLLLINADIIKFYKALSLYLSTKDEQETNNMAVAKLNALLSIEGLKKYVFAINSKSKMTNDLSIINTYEHCISLLNEVFYRFKDVYFIDLKKSSFNEPFKEIIEQFKKSVPKTFLVNIKNNGQINNKVAEPQIDRINKKNHQEQPWFLTGVQLANGEAYKLREGNLSFRHIATTLGFKDTDQTYFSQSIGTYSLSTKNIFLHLDRLKEIINHCQKENIKIYPDFLNECIRKHPNEF